MRCQPKDEGRDQTERSFITYELSYSRLSSSAAMAEEAVQGEAGIIVCVDLPPWVSKVRGLDTWLPEALRFEAENLSPSLVCESIT